MHIYAYIYMYIYVYTPTKKMQKLGMTLKIHCKELMNIY